MRTPRPLSPRLRLKREIYDEIDRIETYLNAYGNTLKDPEIGHLKQILIHLTELSLSLRNPS